MSVTEKQRQQQAELQKNLWSIANSLRGDMDASEFKNYILGMIFYRFLSENTEAQAAELLSEDDITYEDAMADESLRPVLEKELIERIGDRIEPQHLRSHVVRQSQQLTFEIEAFRYAITNIENSTRGHDSEEAFNHLFDDMDLHSTRLGNSNAARTKLIGKVMMQLSELPF